MPLLKPKTKLIRVVLDATELIEMNGDKPAYFLRELNYHLDKQRFIAQFGPNFRTILIYEKEQTYPIYSFRLSSAFVTYLKKPEEQNFSIGLLLPVRILWDTHRRKERIEASLDPKPALTISSGNDALSFLMANPQTTARFENGLFNIYEINKWDKIGVRK